jgi:SAM-dependent methyltransferase
MKPTGSDAFDFFRCVVCKGTRAYPGTTSVRCDDCGKEYEVTLGIPALINDWVLHEAAIDQARRVKPDWYVSEQGQEDRSPWRHHLQKRRVEVESVLRRWLSTSGLQKASTLLDLGCGDGTNLHWLGKYCDKLFASDYNLVRLVRAQARGIKGTLFLADVLDYPAKDNFFDVVFFNHVIEHIENDEVALRTVSRILKPGGLLILGTPNEGCWWWQWAYRRAPDILASTDHVHFYTAETIGAKLLGTNFRVDEIKHLGWGPPDWRWDERLRKYKMLDDLFEILGRLFLYRQASSLYIVATKE